MILMALLAGAYCDVAAQTIDQLQDHHRELQYMKMSGAAESEIYALVYKSYGEYQTILQTMPVDSEIYDVAKGGMLDIHADLYRAAAYYQSRGVAQNVAVFSQAYVDVMLMDAYRDHNFENEELLSSISYLAAYSAYNAKNYDKAIKYMAVYISTGDQRSRETVYGLMANSCIKVNDILLARTVLDEGLSQYPNNMTLLGLSINCCMLQGDNDNLQKYLVRALEVEPDNMELLKNLGKLYEDNQEFSRALEVYSRMNTLKPNVKSTVEHIALNYYNQGVLNFNKASLQETQNLADMYTTRATSYFDAAVKYMEQIVANSPNDIKYMQALAVSYDCLGRSGDFERMNHTLASKGAATVEANVTPTLLTYSAKTLTTTKSRSATSSSKDAVAQSNVLQMMSQQTQIGVEGAEIPKYSVYAADYVTTRLKAWARKDQYETTAEWQARVTEATQEAKKKALLAEAEKNYINTYSKRVRIDELRLMPYDADNEVFLIESEFGELILPVPRARNEAQIFESSWNGIQLKDPEFYISNDQMLLAALTFVTPTGSAYRYDGDKELNYVETVVDISVDTVDANDLVASSKSSSGSKVKKQTLSVEGIKSDVDVDIPVNDRVNTNRYALIIANENYDHVHHVKYAINDGEAFAEYCEKTLGVPKDNVFLYKDMPFGTMLQAMGDIEYYANNVCDGNMELIFYYAGHGILDESTKESYLLPIHGNGTQTRGCYRLADLYQELANMRTKSVTVFLDACFSGADRDGRTIVEARAVGIRPKAVEIPGNLVIFSAVSDDQTSMPYEEKYHGLFTYYLLKKLQDTKGNVTYKELSDYIKKNVGDKSMRVNKKPQTPTVATSPLMYELWQSMSFGR